MHGSGNDPRSVKRAGGQTAGRRIRERSLGIPSNGFVTIAPF